MLIPVALIHYEWRMYQDLYVLYLMIISWEVTITNEGWHLPTKQESLIKLHYLNCFKYFDADH